MPNQTTPETCSVEDCERPRDVRLWCNAHYIRLMRYGDPLFIKPGYVRTKDLTGERFGRLLVIATEPRIRGRGEKRWRCRCDCGSETIVRGGNLQSGNTTSCGCWHDVASVINATTHGLSKTPEYMTWARMKRRCYTPSASSYAYYGGRGITICEHWLHDVRQFVADVGLKPTPEHSIDKDTPGGDGHYHCRECGGNVRWATRKEQRATRGATH